MHLVISNLQLKSEDIETLNVLRNWEKLHERVLSRIRSSMHHHSDLLKEAYHREVDIHAPALEAHKLLVLPSSHAGHGALGIHSWM
jgi:hypothetical protein